MLTAGQAAGSPQTRRALEAFRAEADTAATLEGRSDRWLWLAGRCALGVLDDELLLVLASRHARRARQTGALAMLPAALSFLASVLTLTGELSRASELADEAAEMSEIAGAVPPRDGEIMLAAWRGDRETTAHLVDVMLGDVAYPDDGCEVAVAHYATAVLHNGLGHHAEAQAAAARACKADEPGVSIVGLPELVEAAVRAGRPAVAADAAAQLEERARSCDTPWALGLAARSRALTSEGPVAEDHYREAVERLGRSQMASETARAHLVYGEWLRREGRRQDAREQLRTAHELLREMGAEAFAERASRELRASGEHPRTRDTRPADALTSQEAHVARLVAMGATSREVAAELFLSPRTVEAHLRGIFRKLGITSRRQLKELRLP